MPEYSAENKSGLCVNPVGALIVGVHFPDYYKPGHIVLITQGSVAAAYFTKIKAPIDALIIGSIDEKS